MPAKCYCGGNCTLYAPAAKMLSENNPMGAYHAARTALFAAPDCAKLNGILGQTLLQTNRAAAAEFHFQRAIDIDGATELRLTNLGNTQFQQSKYFEAAQNYAAAIVLNPNFHPAHVANAKRLAATGNLDAACEILQRTQHAAPETPGLKIELANVYERQGNIQGAVLELSTGQIGGAEYLARGRLNEQLEAYEQAWRDFETGNEMLRGAYPYHEKLAFELFQNMKTFTTRSTMQRLRQNNDKAEFCKPLFICGYPRSGTTLIEQSLTAHPLIHAGDELPFITDLAQRSPSFLLSQRPYPFSLLELLDADRTPQFYVMRDYYLWNARYRGLATKGLFTDKMPMNEIHLPLIQLLFPHSPVFYVRRDPRDIVVSNFSNFLTHGFNQAFDLTTCARHYAALDDLLEHYFDKLRFNGNLMQIHYEEFVQNPEPDVREMLDIIGVEFDAACVEPNKNKRIPRTPSANAVSKPLNSGAVGRWKHYEKQLAGIMPILEKTIDRNGY